MFASVVLHIWPVTVLFGTTNRPGQGLKGSQDNMNGQKGSGRCVARRRGFNVSCDEYSPFDADSLLEKLCLENASL